MAMKCEGCFSMGVKGNSHQSGLVGDPGSGVPIKRDPEFRSVDEPRPGVSSRRQRT